MSKILERLYSCTNGKFSTVWYLRFVHNPQNLDPHRKISRQNFLRKNLLLEIIYTNITWCILVPLLAKNKKNPVFSFRAGSETKLEDYGGKSNFADLSSGRSSQPRYIRAICHCNWLALITIFYIMNFTSRLHVV